MVEFMRGFLGGVFKTNNYLKFGVLTGVQRISRESLISEFNNPKGITLNKYKLSVDVNEIERLIVINALPTVNNNITWSSDNPEVATVDEFTGEVTAIEPGNAIITVAAIPDLSPEDGVYAQVKVLVIGQENPATDIIFTNCPITIEEGELLDIQTG